MEEYELQTRGAVPVEEAGNSYSSWEATESGLACPRGPPGKTGRHYKEAPCKTASCFSVVTFWYRRSEVISVF